MLLRKPASTLAWQPGSLVGLHTAHMYLCAARPAALTALHGCRAAAHEPDLMDDGCGAGPLLELLWVVVAACVQRQQARKGGIVRTCCTTNEAPCECPCPCTATAAAMQPLWLANQRPRMAGGAQACVCAQPGRAAGQAQMLHTSVRTAHMLGGCRRSHRPNSVSTYVPAGHCSVHWLIWPSTAPAASVGVKLAAAAAQQGAYKEGREGSRKRRQACIHLPSPRLHS